MFVPSAGVVVAAYSSTREQLIEQLTALDDLSTIEAMMVPSCPEWSVKEVVAHVSGLVADVLAGVAGPLGTDENTSRQVSTRSSSSLVEVCEEWAGNSAAIAAVFADAPMRGFGLTADLAVHVHDLAEMLDGIDVPAVETTLLGCQRYVPLLQERAADTLDLALAVSLEGEQWPTIAGRSPLRMTGTQVDFLRSVTGRRTRSQTEAAFAFQGDPSALLDRAFTQYGPFRPEEIAY